MMKIKKAVLPAVLCSMLLVGCTPGTKGSGIFTFPGGQVIIEITTPDEDAKPTKPTDTTTGNDRGVLHVAL